MSGADKPAKKSDPVEYELSSGEAYRFAAVESEYEYARQLVERATKNMESVALDVLGRVGVKDPDATRCNFDKRNGGIFLLVGGAE